MRRNNIATELVAVLTGPGQSCFPHDLHEAEHEAEVVQSSECVVRRHGNWSCGTLNCEHQLSVPTLAETPLVSKVKLLSVISEP